MRTDCRPQHGVDHQAPSVLVHLAHSARDEHEPVRGRKVLRQQRLVGHRRCRGRHDVTHQRVHVEGLGRGRRPHPPVDQLRRIGSSQLGGVVLFSKRVSHSLQMYSSRGGYPGIGESRLR